MTEDSSKKEDPNTPEKDTYHFEGLEEMNLEMTPSVIICGVGGGALGLVLALWGTSDFGIVFATTFVFAIVSAIVGMFVPWFKPKGR